MSIAVQYNVLKRLFWGVFVALCLNFAGCNPPSTEAVEEVDLPAYKRGQDFLRQGRHDQALTAFLKVVQTNTVAPESHLFIGQLYLQHSKDPVSAIYHFRQYLEFKPRSRQAPMVRDLINTAKKEFARTFPASLFDAELDRMDLLDVIEQKELEILAMKKDLARLKGENDTLKASLEEMEVGGQESANTPSEPTATPAQPRVQPIPRSSLLSPRNTSSTVRPATAYYTVVAGDNLIKISSKVYGTGDRWNSIFEANRDLLENPNAIKVGMKLRIP